ncbi:hypothetical protein EVAR_23032_1 [Eumeta japonica]|uniref:Uncharacterized protein n=1 Tax=Eumeta variegata TaxID=151549 RepID=A0A4C1URC0_EUMVA|nr:hypothetical protein EVAR_23032_1 [Eumeta japonica]
MIEIIDSRTDVLCGRVDLNVILGGSLREPTVAFAYNKFAVTARVGVWGGAVLTGHLSSWPYSQKFYKVDRRAVRLSLCCVCALQYRGYPDT